MLFEGLEADVRHDTSGEGGTGSGAIVESQASAASEPARALTDHLMEELRADLLSSNQPLSAFWERREANESGQNRYRMAA